MGQAEWHGETIMTDRTPEGEPADPQWTLGLAERGIDAVQELLAVLRESDRRVSTLTQRNRELESLVCSDPVTGLLNRHGLEQEMIREEARARRFGSSVTVARLEVSAERTAAGDDALLRHVGEALRVNARRSDVVARLGGDDFAVLLLGTDRTGARTVLERVRSTISPERARLAVGIGTRDEAGSLAEAFRLADERLLSDKAHDT